MAALAITPVEKRLPAVIQAADAGFSRLSVAVRTMLESVRNSARLKDIAPEIGNADRVVTALNLEERMFEIANGAGLKFGQESMAEALQALYKLGGESALHELYNVPVAKESVGESMIFNLINPDTLSFLKIYTFNLIRQVSEETINAIRAIVHSAFEFGGHPYEQARKIKQHIGLTERQARAVWNFRRMLENTGTMPEAMRRALRDRRFDPSILNAIQTRRALSPEQIERMVQRYAERMLKFRAEMIARTETIRASMEGQAETWRQAVRQGFLDATRTRRVWIVTPDDRLCPSCRPIPALNPGGVGLDAPFITERGPHMRPPLHPDCRCALGLKFLPRLP